MDSLMAIEIKQGLERDYEIVMSTQEIRNMKIKGLRELQVVVDENARKKAAKKKEEEELAAMQEYESQNQDMQNHEDDTIKI